MQKKPLFQGTATALITPFKEGKIDFPALARLVEYQIEGGVSALVFCGTTGESATLSPAEKGAIFAFACQEYGQKATIIAGCGSPDTEQTAMLCRMAEASGASGILSVTPYYNKPTPEGIFRHYQALCMATDLPIIVYTVPGRTGCSIRPPLWQKLSTLPNIVGLKEASGDVSLAARCLCLSPLSLYSGCDDLILPLYSLGAQGCISVLSNLVPARVEAIYRMFLDKETENAAQMQKSLLPLADALFAETNPIPVKWALSRLGFCQSNWRLPLTEPSEETKSQIETAMERAGLL